MMHILFPSLQGTGWTKPWSKSGLCSMDHEVALSRAIRRLLLMGFLSHSSQNLEAGKG